uniref:Eukaryotic translation initiation factor 4C n=1 Tax=Phasianus colchicus TaxID=9054 RepID=A0A669QID1_PHACC
MPKNKGKGGKNRRRGKNENESEKRELVFKEDGQEYAQVIKMLGNGRLEALCFDGVKRLCHIRGKLRKKVWINTSDIILVGLRDYQDNKADVILKYNADEARSLKAYGELPEHGWLSSSGQSNVPGKAAPPDGDVGCSYPWKCRPENVFGRREQEEHHNSHVSWTACEAFLKKLQLCGFETDFVSSHQLSCQKR